ncbi:hypothetical protein AVEN_182044-1 [Araneus ventricosus]|uniref:Uncharacterized protein n=1 Tax=Araneus ventricosus TaxID=182803 RepID=A0A4Y2M6N5_ARAVE|nr:hypothetical protein AVEN_182044-1 [Araneus ventricosus]
MSLNTVDDFVKCFLKGLCRKFSLKEGHETTTVDIFCNELLEFSRHFEDYILEDIFQIPALLITSEDLFVVFLNSVCSDICGLEDIVARKFFILCAFITIVTTVTFMLPCYRLVHNVQMVLIYNFKTKLSLNSDVKIAFEDLEEKNLRLVIDRDWICSRLHHLRKFIQKASNTICPGLENQPDIASRLKIENKMKFHKSTNAAESIEDEPCPFCESNCKAFLENLLNC